MSGNKRGNSKVSFILGFVLFLAMLVMSATCSLGQAKDGVDLSFFPKLKYSTFSLKNGMKVMLIPDHRVPIVTHMVWYKVGSADEKRGKSGLAHFFEHLMFKGTDKIASGEFSKIIAKNGGNDNAFTSNDYTAYYQRIAKDRLELVMQMEADRMQNLKLSRRDIETERKVILEERRQRIENNPASELVEQMNSVFYLDHPYRKPVIGWSREIKALTKKDIITFYKKHYSPNNAVLVVAGDVSLEELRPLAEKYYGVLKNPYEVQKRSRMFEPKQMIEKRVVMKNNKVSLPTFQRFYHAPSVRGAKDLETESLSVLAHVLGGGSTSRLYRKLVVEAKLAASVGAYYRGSMRDHGVFIIYGVPNVGVDVRTLEEAIDTVLLEFLESGIDQKDLERAKKTLISDEIYSYDNHFILARSFGSALASDIDPSFLLKWPERINRVRLKDVVEVAKNYLNLENSITGILLPIKKEPPKPIISESQQSKAGNKSDDNLVNSSDEKPSSKRSGETDASKNSSAEEVKEITIQEQEVKQKDEPNK